MEVKHVIELVKRKYLSLEKDDQGYQEQDFVKLRNQNCKKMQGPFLKSCLCGVTALTILRFFILQYVNEMHSYILPTFLVALFWFFKEMNNYSTKLNHYLILFLVPAVVLVVA